MSYMENAHAFAGGIEEISWAEIDCVGGGGGKKLPSPAQFKEFLDFVGNVFTAIEISKLIKEYWPSITNEDLRAIGEYDLNLPYGAAN
jgi:hypothetical protein